jgi:hypothetical protein
MEKPMHRLAMLTALVAGCATAAATPPPVVAPHAAIELAARRAQMLAWLDDYRAAALYPTDALGRPLAVFVDDNGVRCPMAELIHKSGRDDLVDAVRREGNAARLEDVHDGPLLDWMLASGLTQEEIALVQGAMDLPSMRPEVRPDYELVEAKAEVRGRLDTAERALAQNTAHGLDVAMARLPATRSVAELAHAPATRAVLSVQAAAASAVRIAARTAALTVAWPSRRVELPNYGSH